MSKRRLHYVIVDGNYKTTDHYFKKISWNDYEDSKNVISIPSYIESNYDSLKATYLEWAEKFSQLNIHGQSL